VIIDFRLRPPIKGMTSMWVYTDVSMFCQPLYGEPPSVSGKKRDMNMLLKEMDDLEISHGVCGGRLQDEVEYGTDNDELGKLVKKYPTKFTGFAAIDHRDATKAIAEIERSTKRLGLKGINMDVGLFKNQPMELDDPRIYPIYDYCQQMGVPVMSTLGIFVGSDIGYSHPSHIDRICRDFPKMTFIIAHACWPYLEEACGMCFLRSNTYLMMDIYYGPNSLGHQHYAEAVNSILQDRVLYGSAYPMRDLKRSIEAHKTITKSPVIAEKYFYKNAARLLGLSK